MAQYVSKSETVEARQYDGEQPLTVVHDDMGDQVAHKGDWLIGSERGKIRVLSDEKFQARYQPYTASPEADALKASEAQVVTLTAQVGELSAEKASLAAEVVNLSASNSELGAKVGDTVSLSAQVSDLSTKLAAAEAKAAADEQKLADLASTMKAASDAQVVLQQSQDALNKTLGA